MAKGKTYNLSFDTAIEHHSALLLLHQSSRHVYLSSKESHLVHLGSFGCGDHDHSVGRRTGKRLRLTAGMWRSHRRLEGCS